MKKLMIIALSLISTGVMAGENCSFELQSGVRVDKTSLEFTRDNQLQYKILNDRELWVNGRQLQLNPAQQKQLADYTESVRSLVPQTRDLSMDAVDLAAGVVDTLYTEIAEPNSANRKKLLDEFANLKREVGAKFASDKPFYFSEKNGKSDEIIDHEFDARINQIMDSMGEEIAGDVMKKVGASIFSPSKMGEFEAGMEKFGKRMEVEMNQRASKLEQHASSFCQAVKAADQHEETLKQSVKELASSNFITMKPAESQMHDHHQDRGEPMHSAHDM